MKIKKSCGIILPKLNQAMQKGWRMGFTAFPE
jgi:hypothetical protein